MSMPSSPTSAAGASSCSTPAWDEGVTERLTAAAPAVSKSSSVIRPSPAATAVPSDGTTATVLRIATAPGASGCVATVSVPSDTAARTSTSNLIATVPSAWGLK